MTVIGVSLHPAQPGSLTPQITQDRAFMDAIEGAGGVPLFIPPLSDMTALRRLYDLCDGLCMPGGEDVSPEHYGEELLPGTHPLGADGERAEIQLLRWALADRMPLVAVCRGMQLLNVVQGGSLWQDLLEQGATTVAHYHKPLTDLRHEVSIEPDSTLGRVIARDQLSVNSTHHQGVRRLGDGLRVTATSDDGIVEALEIEGHPFAIAVQFHPEVLTPEAPWAHAIFAAHVEAASLSAERGGGVPGARHRDRQPADRSS